MVSLHPFRVQTAFPALSTHTSLHYHLVFSTKNRNPSIDPEWGGRLHEYMGGIIRTMGGISLGVGGLSEHVHLLITLKPVHLVADVLRDLKKSSPHAHVLRGIIESCFANTGLRSRSDICGKRVT